MFYRSAPIFASIFYLNYFVKKYLDINIPVKVIVKVLILKPYFVLLLIQLLQLHLERQLKWDTTSNFLKHQSFGHCNSLLAYLRGSTATLYLLADKEVRL